MNSDSPNTADIVERLEGPVPVFNKNGQASIDLGENYRERKEAAAEITKVREAFALADSLVCAAIEHGFYVGEGLLDKLASARAVLKDHRKAQG